MKAISLWQPWASAVALGWKSNETRHWSTKYRGPIAIHAAKKWTIEERVAAIDATKETGDRRLVDPPRGVIVATAVLVGIERTEDLLPRIRGTIEDWFGNYAPGRFAWKLERISRLAIPIPFTGRQGLFDVPDSVFGTAMEARHG
ncbi:ASCH domain-containing protein [Sphingomonas psychrotolerans]|uniref:ASCH domain-containing protein n=1 Tax=Sphingomonas psychrotolerans TaxID=1327635 RepID=A0ABU3N144_9SPHN|nr:ASCH domain-containing protein [Sphingomonas psychrotolerans]MDT8758262.1 ASCH domain-containing protein [Sphingomonas psychrotolerans]